LLAGAESVNPHRFPITGVTMMADGKHQTASSQGRSSGIWTGLDYRRVLGLGRRRSQPASCGRRWR
jgi:hypothetical protein